MANNKSQILEGGDIYFFYRPKVQPKTNQDTARVTGMADMHRFYMVLHPKQTDHYRLILVGEKKLPSIESEHEKDWAKIEYVTHDRHALVEELNEKTYTTKTRGERLLPAVRPVGEGVYGITYHNRHTYLAYVLELPKTPGKAQDVLAIKPQASYILAVKNPDLSPKRSTTPLHYPASLQAHFKHLHFIPANPLDLLNYQGTELLLIGASTDIKGELGIELPKEQEDNHSADMFNELKLWRNAHPISPLFDKEFV